ncbi:MAG TPA: GNAT family N-acetyltransferase [Casimicrobiaceae bacterium]|nr:GNAT family N-acetyltransferase [Casimicrobiaceae bacterium]
MVAIRALTAGDFDSYFALRQRGLAEHPEAFTSSAEEEVKIAHHKLRARLHAIPDRPHDVVLGAFVADELVGLCGMSVDSRKNVRHRGKVFGMYVPRDRARQGVGSALIAALIEHAKRCGTLDSLVLTVTAGNDDARRLYERHGFREWGREPAAIRVNGKSYDKIHMLCRLSNVE